VEGFALGFELVVGLQRIAGVGVNVEVEDHLIEGEIHRANLLQKLTAAVGGVITAATANGAGMRCLALGAGERLSGELSSGFGGTASQAATATVVGVAGVRLRGQCASAHGAAVGGAVTAARGADIPSAKAVGTVEVLIHHVRLLSARQAQPSAVKPPSPPRGRSSSVNRVPRSKAVAVSYRARKD
jgi:hypothetical protein